LGQSGEIECFATNVRDNSSTNLLVKKSTFLNFLEKNHLNVIWTVLGEKQIIGGRTFGNEFPGRLVFSASYFYDQRELTGKCNITNE